jgi:macrodomain Ter protein organizer (MatP/YcbG family)
MPYAIKYYRDPETVARYRDNGVAHKPVGWQMGRDRFPKALEAEKLCRHINNRHPTLLVQVVKTSLAPTVNKFVPMTRWL